MAHISLATDADQDAALAWIVGRVNAERRTAHDAAEQAKLVADPKYTVQPYLAVTDADYLCARVADVLSSYARQMHEVEGREAIPLSAQGATRLHALYAQAVWLHQQAQEASARYLQALADWAEAHDLEPTPELLQRLRLDFVARTVTVAESAESPEEPGQGG